jgi:uncharacterized protein DUF3293
LAELLPLVVITAWNPGDERPGPAANAAAHQELLERLSAIAALDGQVQILRAVGRAVDGSHSEVGAAVHGLPRSDAIALGHQLRQDAIFEITVHGISVADCCD